MSTDNEKAILAVSDEIRSYLESHPDGMDSAKGIARWWWQQERYRKTQQTVVKALELLVEKGVLRKRVTHGETLYCLITRKQ